jgi:hypothetical protein
MAAFNSMPAPSPREAMRLTGAMAGSGLGIDTFDPDMNFDDAML